MKLADGKVVLVLEGGYELNALAECGKSCVEALLGREVPVQLLFGGKHFTDVLLDVGAVVQSGNARDEAERARCAKLESSGRRAT